MIRVEHIYSPSPSGEGLGWGRLHKWGCLPRCPTPIPSPEGEGLE
jgi:hypothetical protein